MPVRILGRKSRARGCPSFRVERVFERGPVSQEPVSGLSCQEPSRRGIVLFRDVEYRDWPAVIIRISKSLRRSQPDYRLPVEYRGLERSVSGEMPSVSAYVRPARDGRSVGER